MPTIAVMLLTATLQESKNFHWKVKRDLLMACHTPFLKEAKKQGKCRYPSSVPSDSTFYEWDGPEDGQWHFPLFLYFYFERWNMTGNH